MNNNLVILRGGGDLASGIAMRLHRAGFSLVILELPSPLAVRRTVSFSNAVYEGKQTVEGITARLTSADQIVSALELGEIPVLIDPEANILRNSFVVSAHSTFLIDARLLKSAPEKLDVKIPLHIGLGPGFVAGDNCHAVIETQRGHTLGRVYWNGPANQDSGQPEGDTRRVLRSPAAGKLSPRAQIGDSIEEGQVIAEVAGRPIISPLKGVLRGLIHENVEVTQDMKIGDVDPRNDSSTCYLVSDKALAVGGAALEAMMVFLRREAKQD